MLDYCNREQYQCEDGAAAHECHWQIKGRSPLISGPHGHPSPNTPGQRAGEPRAEMGIPDRGEVRQHGFGAGAISRVVTRLDSCTRPHSKSVTLLMVVWAIAVHASCVKNPWWAVMSTLGKDISRTKTSS